METIELDAHYWNQRHLEGNTPWHINAPSPSLMTYFDQLTDKNIRILIPGAGHSHEARYLAEAGFKNITICDISEAAISNIKKELSDLTVVNYVLMDFFELDGEFDLIVEQTFFCALLPALREAYVDKMYHLLSKNGTLAGVLFNCHFEKAGPPFGGDTNEYKVLFGKKLYIKSIEICYNSIPPRRGNEVFFICRKL